MSACCAGEGSLPAIKRSCSAGNAVLRELSKVVGALISHPRSLSPLREEGRNVGAVLKRAGSRCIARIILIQGFNLTENSELAARIRNFCSGNYFRARVAR